MVVTGGGTAGHVIPSKRVVEKLVHRGDSVTFIGSRSGLEQRLIADWNIDFVAITTGKLRRYISFQNLIDAFKVPIGILQSLWILARTRPHAVFAKGGYVAFPVVFAAWILRIPVVAHESDRTPGLATRLYTPFVKTLCVNFANTTIKATRVITTGTPVRIDLLNGDARRGREWLGVGTQEKVIVVVGGSLGAEAINKVIRETIESLTEKFFVVHVCGPGHLDSHLEGFQRYKQFEFLNEQWGDVLACADLVISRSGANALYELLTLRKPHLLIPLPLTKSRGDQIENADYAANHGWSSVLLEEQLEKQQFLSRVDEIHQNLDQWREQLQTFPIIDSTQMIIEEIDRVARS